MKCDLRGPTVLFGYDKEACDIIVNTGCTAKTRHYERAILIVKDLFARVVVAPFLVSTDVVIADIFTKVLDHSKFASSAMLNSARGHRSLNALSTNGRMLWNALRTHCATIVLDDLASVHGGNYVFY